jgi:hypothetical protein
MSRFAKVNLLEVEDSVAGRVDGLEGRFGRKHLDSRDLGVSLFRYAPNLRSPLAHSHKEQEEAYVVVAGSGRILLDDETQELRTGMSSASRPKSSEHSRPARTGSTSSPSAAPSPRRATASEPPRPGPAANSQAGCSAVDHDGRSGDPAFDDPPTNRAIAFSYRTIASPTGASATRRSFEPAIAEVVVCHARDHAVPLARGLNAVLSQRRRQAFSMGPALDGRHARIRRQALASSRPPWRCGTAGSALSAGAGTRRSCFRRLQV